MFIVPRTSLYRGFTVYQRSVYVRKCVTNKCCLIIESENCVLISLEMHELSTALSQNGWDSLGSPCPLNVGAQDLVTERDKGSTRRKKKTFGLSVPTIFV